MKAMTPLYYLNKDLRSLGGRRSLHEPRRPDLQKTSREARIEARKRLFRKRTTTLGNESAWWLTEGLRLSGESLRSCLRETMQLARRYPLWAAAGAISAGMIMGMLVRRR